MAVPSACSRDDVTGLPGMSASSSANSSLLGGVIIFSTLEFGRQSQLAVMQPDGSGRRRLTNDDHGYIYGAISPDGRRIVFNRFTADDQSEGIFLMNADGSGQMLLVNRSPIFDGGSRRGLLTAAKSPSRATSMVPSGPSGGFSSSRWTEQGCGR